MSVPVHHILQLMLPVAVLLNFACAGLNLWATLRLWKARKRMMLTREMMESLTEELQTRAACLTKGHNWTIETQPLHNEKDQRMTVFVVATCADCGTHLRFEILFGVDQMDASTWHAWAGLKPERPPG